MTSQGSIREGDNSAYHAFLARKAIMDPPTGLAKPPKLAKVLFPFQRDIVNWALRRGRAAVFAGTGLGKSLMELSWADAVHRATGKDILHLAPLAVSAQMVREAEKFNIVARQVKAQRDCEPGTNITNYQKLEHFDLDRFGGVILDESSILKSYDGHYRTKLIQACAQIPFRLAATATPAPNDFMELGNHAEFLGVMSYTDMLATFFTHDGSETQKWRLKGHAESEFWRWMASWAVMLRKPSDLGYENAGYDLPALNQIQHIVAADYAPNMDTGTLFPMQASDLQERIKARRGSVDDRVAKVVSIVSENLWQPDLHTCAPTISPIKNVYSAKHLSSATHSTSASATNADKTPSFEIISESEPNRGTPNSDDGQNSKKHLASAKRTTKPSTQDRAGVAPFAERSPQATKDESASPSIIATTQASCGDFYAETATEDLGSSETMLPGFVLPLTTSTTRQPRPWLIWCNLNSEQDALERAFAGKCISVRGSDTEEEKEARILAWLSGAKPIMLSKPSIMGYGLNFQHCADMVFVGLSDSFEQVYQATRRCWRFGQTKPVNVHFIASEIEGAVVANLKRKEADADRMASAMVAHMADLSSEIVRGAVRDKGEYNPQTPVRLPDWLGDAA